ncbi:hypothetical protein ACQ4PT_038518 [Festuca glaucescens]
MVLLLLRKSLPLFDNYGTRHDHGSEPMIRTFSCDVIIKIWLLNDEELAIAVHQQSIAVDGPYGGFGCVPQRIVILESVENEQEKSPDFCYKEGAQKSRTKETITYKRKEGGQQVSSRPRARRSRNQRYLIAVAIVIVTRMMISNNCHQWRKRWRLLGSKCAKRKTDQKLLSVDSSNCDGKKDKDANYKPEALPIFLDGLVTAWGAVLISVTLILLFDEILPQFICSRYGLAIGTSMLVWIWFPVAYPIAKETNARGH